MAVAAPGWPQFPKESEELRYLINQIIPWIYGVSWKIVLAKICQKFLCQLISPNHLVCFNGWQKTMNTQIYLIGIISFILYFYISNKKIWKLCAWWNVLLIRAAECTDSYEQMAYVAAFTISSYSTTATRTGKPFNPLLGETFECDRTDDLGWRAISEQVSHHPPMLAQHCEGKKWRCWQEFTMASKFRGKYLQVQYFIYRRIYSTVYLLWHKIFFQVYTNISK